MKKYTSHFKFVYGVQSQFIPKWYEEATHETHPKHFGLAKFCIVDGVLWKNYEKHYTGVGSNQRARGGKWELSIFQGDDIYPFLERLGAVEENFRGGPRIKK